MAIKLTISTLRKPDIPIAGAFSHVVTIGDRLAIDVLQTTSPEAVSQWVRRLPRDAVGNNKATDLLVGLEIVSQKAYWNIGRFVYLIVLCVGSSALFYYNAHRCPFSKPNRCHGKPVAKDLRKFCAGPGVKFVGRGLADAAEMLSDCGLEFAQAPVELEALVEGLLKRPMTKGENMDAVTTALWGERAEMGSLAGNEHDGHWDDEDICNFVFNAYLATEVGRKVALP